MTEGTPETETPIDADEADDTAVGTAVKWSLAAIAAAAAAVGAYVVVSGWLEPPPPDPQPIAATTVRDLDIELPEIPFTDITDDAGIRFVHESGARGRKLLPESMGGGVAFFDYNGDGAPDLLLVGSTTWDAYESGADAPPSLALYANTGNGTFADRTEEAGLDQTLYGMGCAVGDYDSDGDLDLYVTAVGPNRLYRNDDGRFVDVTERTGTAGGESDWTTAAGFFDYDRDGDLDLVAVNYLDWSIESDASQDFRITGGGRAYGRPGNFGGTLPLLFRNDGPDRLADDGTGEVADHVFAEVAEESGLHVRNADTDVPAMKSLGLGIEDIDGDGWLDLLVANDTVRNCLFLNDRDGTFTEEGITSGIAFDDMGNARGAMGVDIARFRSDDSLGIVIGNFANEMTALYVDPLGETLFSDEAVASGLGPQTRLRLTFGVLFVDADLDGRLDIAAANGHLDEDIALVQQSQTYEQPPQLFWNAGDDGETEFVPLGPDQIGGAFFRPMVGRGLAAADIDRDGDLDLVLTAVGQRPRLLRNDLDPDSTRSVRLIGLPIGTRVRFQPSGEPAQTRIVMPTRGYLSQSELPLTFAYSLDAGDGDPATAREVAIEYTLPDGSVHETTALLNERFRVNPVKPYDVLAGWLGDEK